MTKVFYTYLHVDLNGQVFYVGCATKHKNKRGVKAKTQRAYAKDGHNAAWLAVAQFGYSVVILQEHTDRDAAFAQEREYIAAFRAAGMPLVNICDGGSGCPGVKNSADTKRKKSVTKIGALNPMYGKTGSAHPTSRKVRDRETGVVFDSVQIAADSLGFKMKTLYNWLSGHRQNPTTLEFA